jgi:pilus assembly protein Flp/PilA
MTFFLRFLRNKVGATAIEYGVILGLIAVFLIGATTLFGANISGVFNTISNRLK